MGAGEEVTVLPDDPKELPLPNAEPVLDEPLLPGVPPAGWPIAPALLLIMMRSAFGSYQNSHSLKCFFFFHSRMASLGLVLSTPITPPPPKV